MKFKPLHDRILIKRSEKAEEIKGGIIIPDTAKEKPQQGKVVAVGMGKTLRDGTRLKLTVEVNDRVIFGKFSGTEVKLDNEEFLIMKEEDIFGIISKK